MDIKLQNKINEHRAPALRLKNHRETILMMIMKGFNASDIWRFFNKNGYNMSKSKVYYYIHKYPICDAEKEHYKRTYNVD